MHLTTIALVILIAVLVLGIGALLMFTDQLAGQNGRLIVRVDRLEGALRHLRLVLPGGEPGLYFPNAVGAFVAAHPGLHLREQSNDLDILYEVVDQNSYRLPAVFSLNDVIVDVGTHAGFFAMAVLFRGCGEVHCFEPDPSNAASARHHLAPYGKRAHLTEAAVWRSDIEQTTLHFQASTDDFENLGGGDVLRGSGREVAARSFDDVIRQASRDGARRIRLVKVDCEGSEYPILLTSTLLHLIDEICGEYHAIPAELTSEWDFGQEFTFDALASHLMANGFDVTPAPFPAEGSNALGLFFARRRM